MMSGDQLTLRTQGGTRASGILSLLIALSLAGCAGLFLNPTDRSIEGRANATDGDSLRIGNLRIRLEGIDAPELNQTCVRGGQSYPCGEAARDALLSAILRHPVKCRSKGRDKYKRILAKCSAGDVDLGAHMVNLGWAIAYGDYASEQSRAQSRRVGLWIGTFDSPREWRRLHPSG